MPTRGTLMMKRGAARLEVCFVALDMLVNGKESIIHSS